MSIKCPGGGGGGGGGGGQPRCEMNVCSANVTADQVVNCLTIHLL